MRNRFQPCPRRPVIVGALPALVVGLAMLAAPFPRPAIAQTDSVVARVNGVDIREGDLAMVEEDIGQGIPNMTGDARRDYLITFLTDIMLASQAAESKNIQSSEEFKRRSAYSRNKVLMELLLQSEAKAAANEPAMRKVYEEATKDMKAEKEVRARHILVETEDEAKAVLSELKKGADFAELAKQKSKDPGSTDGGDLGYFTKDQMVSEFAETAFKLQKGQLSDPVKTQFGWHIIKAEDQRDREVPSFEKVKDQIENYVTRRAQAETIAKLRETAKIERLEKKPDPAPAPTPAPPAGAKK